MTEKVLANRLRLALVAKVNEIDLPKFLLEQIDKNLLELNYFKLSNLYTNVDRYIAYLIEIQITYVEFIIKHNPPTFDIPTPHIWYDWYMTDSLYETWVRMHFSAKELLKVQSLFSVTCILRMKEFINKRKILSKTETLKQESHWWTVKAT